MRLSISRRFALGLATLICCGWLLAVPALKRPFQVEQPDGTTITIRLMGDEWYSYHETVDGYTVLKNREDWWVYADLDQTGRFQASEHRVGVPSLETTQYLERTGKNLAEAPAHVRIKSELYRRIDMDAIIEFASKEAGKRATTYMDVPVILIDFPNFASTETVQSFDDMMNQVNYGGTGSFRDYYLEISYGDLDITADIYGWYTAANNEAYYGYNGGVNSAWLRAVDLVREAVDAAQTGASPTWSDYDNDNDGDVDVVFVVHADRGAECGGAGANNRVWSHRWVLAGNSQQVTYGGKLINDYVIQPEKSCFGTNQHIEIGVFCHEFGHALGLPDLYDVDGSSEGIGNWGLMAGGSYGGDGQTPETPTHMSAWCKIETGWVTPTVVTANQVGTSIQQVETNREIYKLWSNGVAGQQYFLVENRQLTGYDANLPTAGLAIWHIDEGQRTTNNTDNADETHKLVDLEAADGLAHMDAGTNRGDAGDLFPGSTNNTTFNANTNPNSRDYNGGDTAVCVQNISAPSATMTADFCVTNSLPPNLLVRDCANDVGAEPDTPCNNDWVRSLDIWIDNDDDGVIDAPIQGQVNHLYVRNWNIGGPTTDAKLRCWYVNPSLGLVFPGSGTPIIDVATSSAELTIPSMGTLAPSPGGLGYRAYFEWNIPTPPPNIHHYCIGCVLQNTADPQVSQVPLQENNLGQINYWALAQKAGTTPAKRGEDAIFRTQVEANNQFKETSDFVVRVEELTKGFAVEAKEVELRLKPGDQEKLVFDIIRENARHQDKGHVAINLYKLPENILVGSLRHDLLIDNYEPNAVSCLDVGYTYEFHGDNFPAPEPNYQISWCRAEKDAAGFEETIRYYEIHAADSPDLLRQPNERTLVTQTKADHDKKLDGHQFKLPVTENDKEMFFTVVPVDLAGNVGKPAPIIGAPALERQPGGDPTQKELREAGEER